MNDRLAKAEALFHEALELPAEQRETFLQRACGEHAELFREVAALLRASGVADRWLRETERESLKEVLGAMIGRYKLLEVLGEGGYGAVWLAEQREPVRRKVALKILKLGMDSRPLLLRLWTTMFPCGGPPRGFFGRIPGGSLRIGGRVPDIGPNGRDSLSSP